MPITTKDGLLEAWATQLEALEQNLETLYGPPGITPSLPDVTNVDGMLEAIAEQTESAYLNFAKLYNAYYNIASDEYTISLPGELLDWYGIKELGGKTVVWNQLIDDAHRQDSLSGVGITVTISGNKFTFSGTTSASGNYFFSRNSISVYAGHKYLLWGVNKLVGGNILVYDSTNSKTLTTFTPTEAGSTRGEIFTVATDSSALNVYYNVNGTGVTVDSEVEPMLFDLTLMFGSGNEPSSVSEFQQVFPAEYYSYSAPVLLSAGVTDVLTKDSTDTIIDAYDIPAEVQALDGYGLSAGNVYNYIDFKNKKFVQNVGAVDMSDLTFGYGPTVGWSATLTNVKDPADDDTAFNGISATFTPTTRNAQATAFSGGTDAGMVSVAGGKVYVGTGSISIVPAGILYYELDTPVETDISEYLTTDIKVEGGGTLTFENQNGDSYRIPVPVRASYIGV